MLSHRHADRQDGWQLWKTVSNGKNVVLWLLQIIAAGGRMHLLEVCFIDRCYCGAWVIWVWRLTLLSSWTGHGFRLKNSLTRSEETYQNPFPHQFCSKNSTSQSYVSKRGALQVAPRLLSQGIFLSTLSVSQDCRENCCRCLGTVTLHVTLRYGSPGSVYRWDMRNRPVSIDHLRILLSSWIRQRW